MEKNLSPRSIFWLLLCQRNSPVCIYVKEKDREREREVKDEDAGRDGVYFRNVIESTCSSLVISYCSVKISLVRVIFMISAAPEANEPWDESRMSLCPRSQRFLVPHVLPTPVLVYIQVVSLIKVLYLWDFTTVQNQEWRRTHISVHHLKDIIKY